MNTHDRSTAPPDAHGACPIHRSSRVIWWVLGGLAAVVLVLVTLEDRTRLLAWIPWLVVVACPLVHLFMHRGNR